MQAWRERKGKEKKEVKKRMSLSVDRALVLARTSQEPILHDPCYLRVLSLLGTQVRLTMSSRYHHEDDKQSH